MMLAAITALVSLAPIPGELDAYIRKPDPTYRIRETRREEGRLHVRFTSQTWQSFAWEHDLVTIYPRNVRHRGVAILFITGGNPDERDLAIARIAAESSGMPVATLFQIPSQPLWDKREDALIAHTFVKYLETKDASWPLLFPMTKSAVRAMDALTTSTRTDSNPIKRFVVTGASKRGWTTWLTAATGDRRVIGIAPMVYDNLDLNAQMKHQKESWGRFSDEINDYTELDLQAALSSTQGQRLAAMVDPHAYLSRIKIPTLIINGANDPYWTVDALSLYWNDLKQPRYASIVPNAGHNLGDGRQALEALGGFARSVAGEYSMPVWSASVQAEEGIATVEFHFERGTVKGGRVLMASSSTRQFASSKWEQVGEIRIAPSARGGVPPQRMRVRHALPDAKFVAVLLQAEFTAGGQSFVLSQPVQVIAR